MPRHQIAKTKTAQLWLRSCLRHPYEARSPLGSQSSDPSRFTRKSVSNISTHRVSIYDPFIPRWTPSLDSRPPFGILFLIGYCNRPEPRPTSQWADLLRLSLISVWSDMRRHWLLPTRRARINERRLSAACGVTRLTDCASMLFPLHVCHTRYTCVHVAACFMRTSPLNSQFPPPCAHPHPQSRSPHIQPTPPTQSHCLVIPPPSVTDQTLTVRQLSEPTSRSTISATRES